jgi:glycosyltransferase involved in cell wall biosynthesis
MNTHVNFFCHFNHTGIGRHCENAFFSMSRRRPDGMALEYVNNTREASIRRAMDAAQAQTDVTLFFWRYPEQLVRQFRGRRILWWFFESDRLAPTWLAEIGVYDRIWAPSHWARTVLLDHDVPADRIRVVPSGVNTRIFHPAPPKDPGAFVFLCVGKYEKRKSIDETVAAFGAEFPCGRYPQVQLWLKADFPLYPERVQLLARKLAHDPRIRVVSGGFSDERMAELYRSADAFVFASKAEGFGLPLLEAIACGIPAIATDVSAQAEFLGKIPGLFAPVAHAAAPIDDDDYRNFYGADYAGAALGSWAMPSMDSLRRAMRAVYEEPVTWRSRALRASETVRESFCWDAIAARAIAALVDSPAVDRGGDAGARPPLEDADLFSAGAARCQTPAQQDPLPSGPS